MKTLTAMEYQVWVRAMWNWQKPGAKLKKLTQRDEFIMATGLGGEAGEVLEILKKHKRSRDDDSKIDLRHLKEELGDVLYMLAMIASRYDITMDEVIKYNVEKIEKRRHRKLALKRMARFLKKKAKSRK